MPPILETVQLSKRFGGLRALQNVDLAVEDGEIFGLIGPNGSGKTTCMNVITGFLSSTSGSTLFRGEPITKLPPHKIARRGIVRTFQLTSLFDDLTVRENVVHASHLHSHSTLLGSIVHSRGFRREQAALAEKATEVLTYAGIRPERHDVLARALSAGEQRYLEVAIALAAEPQLLLLDEPATGLNPEETALLMALIQSIRDQGKTVILVEHNMKVIMGICTRIAVLRLGQKIAEGLPDEIATNDEVIEAYLGKRRGA
jgi:branched-chain amino acid transport system ATP-binding protein